MTITDVTQALCEKLSSYPWFRMIGIGKEQGNDLRNCNKITCTSFYKVVMIASKESSHGINHRKEVYGVEGGIE